MEAEFLFFKKRRKYMYKYMIEGSNNIGGVLKVSGSKNASLPLLVAAILTDEPVILHNVPDLVDVHVLINILEPLGKKVDFRNNTTVIISPVSIWNCYFPLGCQIGSISQRTGPEYIPVIGKKLWICPCIQAPVIGDRMAHVGSVCGMCIDKENRIPVVHQLYNSPCTCGL